MLSEGMMGDEYSPSPGVHYSLTVEKQESMLVSGATIHFKHASGCTFYLHSLYIEQLCGINRRMFICLMFDSDCLKRIFSEFMRKKGEISLHTYLSDVIMFHRPLSIWLIIQIKDIVVSRQNTQAKEIRHRVTGF